MSTTTAKKIRSCNLKYLKYINYFLIINIKLYYKIYNLNGNWNFIL